MAQNVQHCVGCSTKSSFSNKPQSTLEHLFCVQSAENRSARVGVAYILQQKNEQIYSDLTGNKMQVNGVNFAKYLKQHF